MREGVDMNGKVNVNVKVFHTRFNVKGCGTFPLRYLDS